ncbi:MAG: hypothetical protein HZC42_14400 [Candidatus Eisenbacteria bacterium]|nr:hypothetical protein [Candidatus Eisenbacteria bacterium]
MRRILIVTLAALALAGCGDRHLILNVDVLSYLDPADTQAAFGPVPPIPGGFESGEQPLVSDATINLLEGMNSVAAVQTVSITMAAVVSDSSGSGLDTLRVYASDVDTDPLTTAPLIESAFALQPGVTDTVQVELPADPRVAALFTQRQMRLTITTSLHGPSAGDPLNGRIRLSRLDAVVVAGRKGF